MVTTLPQESLTKTEVNGTLDHARASISNSCSSRQTLFMIWVQALRPCWDNDTRRRATTKQIKDKIIIQQTLHQF